ncbi:unnamed protein product [Cuscuta epithymum]|uniref:Uncharacterized protein n=1 Tax=Cuscuta epithymum TaxID=186058 RepID=A0AAV0G8M6_9ASTE|nr:unnamed protein product [Cuscuta epithymum]
MIRPLDSVHYRYYCRCLFVCLPIFHVQASVGILPHKVMEHRFRSLPGSSINRFELENDIISSTFQQSVDVPDSNDTHALVTSAPALNSDPVLDYINQILLEEDSIDGDNQNMFFNLSNLRATQKSFYEALRGNPSSPSRCNSGTLDITFGSSSDDVGHLESKSIVTSDWDYGVDSIVSKSFVASDWNCGVDSIASKSLVTSDWNCGVDSTASKSLVTSDWNCGVDYIASKSLVTSDWNYGFDCIVSKSFVKCDPPSVPISSSSSQSCFDGLSGALCSLGSLDSVPNIFCDEHTESTMNSERGVKEANNLRLPPEDRGGHVNIDKDQSADSLWSLGSLDSVPNIFCDEHTQPTINFERGVKEASNFRLP